MFEGIEVFPHPADLEQIYLHHQGATNAGHFAGLPGGRLRLQTWPGVPCDGLSARWEGDAGEAAGVYPGQQRGAAAAPGPHAEGAAFAGRGEGEIPRLVRAADRQEGEAGPLDGQAGSL